MMKKVIIFLLIVTTITFYQCVSKPNKRGSSLGINRDWLKDKNGCIGLRNKELANKLIANKSLLMKSKNKFLNVFGPPNAQERTADSEVLIYYFNGICQGNELSKEADKCYASFYFKHNKLTSTDFTCE